MASNSTDTPPYNADRYHPSLKDVLAVKLDLLSLRLPLELVDAIIDHGEYWPHVKVTREGTPLTVRNNDNRFVLRSYPLGFMPGDNAHADYQMTDQYQANFSTLAPQPWKEGREIPNNALDEVMKEWTATTQPRTGWPCRKIVFTLISHDQGWGGGPAAQGQYEGSFSWFDVGSEEMSAFKEDAVLEAWEKAPWPQFRLHHSKDSESSVKIRDSTFKSPSHLVCSLRTIVPETVLKNPPPDSSDEEEDENNVQGPGPQHTNTSSGADYEFKHELCPTSGVLQKNIVSDRNPKTHVITWSHTDTIEPESPEWRELYRQGRGEATGSGEYVRNMKLGDCITVWAKARFPGWVNVVDKVEIDVYWAV